MRFGTPICPSLGWPGACGLPGHHIFAALALFRPAGRLSGFPGRLSGPSETRFGMAIIAPRKNPARRSRGGSGRRGLPPRRRIWPKSLCFPVAPDSLGGARIGPSGAAAGPGRTDSGTPKGAGRDGKTHRFRPNPPTRRKTAPFRPPTIACGRIFHRRYDGRSEPSFRWHRQSAREPRQAPSGPKQRQSRKNAVSREPPGPGPTQGRAHCCLLYTSPSPRDATLSRMPSSA